MSTKKLLPVLVEAGQDFEWYPTTEEIIAALVADIKRPETDDRPWRWRPSYRSVLDIGAGNGKVLLALRDRAELHDLHAIEKSQLLCEQLDPSILIVGTEFHEQSLLTKQVDLVFSNPPYSEFARWAVKIIRESAAQVIYLVLPTRWSRSTPIKDALRYREAEATIVGRFDFHNAEDRSARASVHLLRIETRTTRHAGDEAFERFFNEQFAHLREKFEQAKPEKQAREAAFSQLVVGTSYLESLVELYQRELAKVQRNFDLVGKLDVDLLREFNVSPESIRDCLKTKLAGLRHAYWHELFGHLDKVTDRLTSGSRKKLLDIMSRHVHVDFTLGNAYAVVIWVIKNANQYIDSQLLDTYATLVEKCNVVLYKSNRRTWVEGRWRYSRSEEDPNSHYALDYRLVTHAVGGCSPDTWQKGLRESAADFMGDLCTLAHNLGFKGSTMPLLLTYQGRQEWVAGQRYEFHGYDRKGEPCVLFEARAFLNGNLHLRMHKGFLLALNVEHGRLRGWLRSKSEAVKEMQDPAAGEYFFANTRLAPSSLQMLPAPEKKAA